MDKIQKLFKFLKNKKHKHKKKKTEFSKIIIICVGFMSFFITIFSCWLMWYSIDHSVDTSPLAYLIPSIFGELATATGFYYNKAKNENTKGGVVYDKAMGNIVSDVVNDIKEPFNNSLNEDINNISAAG